MLRDASDLESAGLNMLLFGTLADGAGIELLCVPHRNAAQASYRCASPAPADLTAT